jgi:hypothetical protein
MGSMTVLALALKAGLRLDSLDRDNTAAFTRQAAVCAEQRESGADRPDLLDEG